MGLPVKDSHGISEYIPEMIKQLSKKEQVATPHQYFFADNIAMRVTTMPAGIFAIGKKHKYKTINILLKGRMTVYNGDNEPIQEVTAPAIWVSESGVQKMAYFHEETVWCNPLPTSNKDYHTIEDEFIEE